MPNPVRLPLCLVQLELSNANVLLANLLTHLPASLEWLVAFRVSSVRKFASDSTIREMYFLPQDLDISKYAYVVLTSHGRYVATSLPPLLISIENKQTATPEPYSVAKRFQSILSGWPIDEADCLGLGERAPYSPVLLFLKIDEKGGEAAAVFDHEPSTENYELLRAVGVEYLGGKPDNVRFVANFRNRLGTHVRSGEMAGFSRTAHCNDFFLQHGEIDSRLEKGLLQALQTRVGRAADNALLQLERSADRACLEPLSMSCLPPTPETRFDYGDLVPLAWVPEALGRSGRPEASVIKLKVAEKLLAQRREDLWSFHTGRLLTATDTAILLNGLPDSATALALERFSDGEGAFVPQLWSEKASDGKMLYTDDNAHWCQADFATTCLVCSGQRASGVGVSTPLGFFEQRFESRGGLFFANPYLVDWSLAVAIANDPDAGPLRARLAREILDSRNEEFSFGVFDVPLSTAFAILALAALGYRDRTLKIAQLALTDQMNSEGRLSPCNPFYSTFKARPGLTSRTPQVVEVGGAAFEISLYRDAHRLIEDSVAILALTEKCDPSIRGREFDQNQDRHPHLRYRCGQLEYIRNYALAPYIQPVEAAAGR